MKPQKEEKKNVQEMNENEKQAKPAKRTLRAADLRHMPGIAVKTDLKVGEGEANPAKASGSLSALGRNAPPPLPQGPPPPLW